MAAAKKKKDALESGTVALNRRARHDYEIEDTIEAGVMLLGTEVKSLRTGRASIAESYASLEADGDFYLVNANIPEYGPANRFNHEPKRLRKLLLHRREIGKLGDLVRRSGYTMIPLSLYFNNRGIAKIKLGIARGKKNVDKRHSEKERDWKRQQARILRDKG
ncbi:SsrA-binding protein SmpB [Kiloniella sp. b19]|uniref:SsrA-binding protein SmpB n=1 Tax=Kiloniella sp. GXU_MW_B19 TaxID=3141326 RepID=UPI0031D96EB2